MPSNRDRATPAAVAARCGLHPDPTARLLGVLATAGYVSFDAGRYSLTNVSRRWLLKSAATSLHDNMLFQYIEWKLLEGTEDFLRTGKPIDFHGGLGVDEWDAGLSPRKAVRFQTIPGSGLQAARKA